MNLSLVVIGIRIDPEHIFPRRMSHEKEIETKKEEDRAGKRRRCDYRVDPTGTGMEAVTSGNYENGCKAKQWDEESERWEITGIVSLL